MTENADQFSSSTFQASRMDDLVALTEFVGDACHRARADPETAFAMRLAVEEAFTNILRHGYPTHIGPVCVRIESDGQRLHAILTDQASTFHPDDVPVPDIAAPLEQREPGGLGWHLIRQMMDEVHHRPGDHGGNRLTLLKRYAREDPHP